MKYSQDKFHAAILALLLLTSTALAADFGCGRDTDRNGSVDNLCPGGDQDYDGVAAADGDCDDGDWQIFPGVSTGKGCTAGQWRTCKADGTGWTSCSSAQWNPTNAAQRLWADDATDSVVYFDDAAGSNSTGDGSFGNPYQDLRKISVGYSGAITPANRTAYILRGGTYDTDYSSSGNWHARISTSCADNCIIACYPGETCILRHTDSAKTFYQMVFNASGWWVDGIEFDRADTGEGGAIDFREDTGAGAAATNLRARRIYAHNMDGVDNDNLSALRCEQGSTCRFTHNYIADIWDSADPGDQNTGGIVFFRGGANQAKFNVIVNNGSQNLDFGIKVKHAAYASSYLIEGNYISGHGRGIAYGSRNTTIRRNLIIGAATGIEHGDQGGPSYSGDNLIEYNTVVVSDNGFQLNPRKSYNINASGAADECSGDYEGEFLHQYNVIQNSRSSFNQENAILTFDTYRSDLLRADYLVGGLLLFSNNCYYSTTSQTLLVNEYAANNGNLTCAGRGDLGGRITLAEWQAAPYSNDAGTTATNPSLASGTYFAESMSCEDKGYSALFSGSPPPTPTPAPVTTGNPYLLIQ
jgi:hypothetical protein